MVALAVKKMDPIRKKIQAMIKPLRKRHFQVWMALAVLIPAGIIMAWLVIPNQPPVKSLLTAQPELLPVLVQSADKKNYWVNLRSNAGQTDWQIEWVNKYPLTVPAAVIYQKKDPGYTIGKNKLVGRIEATGSYTFPLAAFPEPAVFYLYDFIKEKVIDTVSFTLKRRDDL